MNVIEYVFFFLFVKFVMFCYSTEYLLSLLLDLLFFFFSSQRIELNETVEFIYGKEKNPCMSPTRMNWYDWVVGRDSRSACRDFLE